MPTTNHRIFRHGIRISGACLALAMALPAEEGAPPAENGALPAPLFEASYDGSADATKSGGAARPLRATGLEFAEGVRGQAVVVRKDALLEYASAGNLVQEHGGITMWFRPNWRAADMSTDSIHWHSLFSQPHAEPRAGSGALMFWFWGPMLRCDLSDRKDSYRTGGSQGLDQTRWAHLAFTWDALTGSRMYLDGQAIGLKSNDAATPLDLSRAAGFPELRNRIDAFRIGSQGGWAAADGRIDELRIYDRALTPAQVLADRARVSPLVLDCPGTYVLAGSRLAAAWSLANASAADAPGGTWRIEDPRGATVASGADAGAALRPGERRAFSAQVASTQPGEYRLTVEAGGAPAQRASLWALGGGGQLVAPSGSQLAGKLIATIDFAGGPPAGRFTASGTCRTGSLAGRGYLEAGANRNDRFAVQVDLPAAGVPYLIEWDYPDDRLRTGELVAQDALHPDSDYGLQTGVFCGDEYPASGRILTHRSILWARSTSAAFIFMTARTGAPVAVAQLRVSAVGGLPDAGVAEAPAVDGWTRTIGIHFEDPSLGYDFGIEQQLMPGFATTIDRLIAYMRWSGQDLLSYPAVWYHGRIGADYQPRLHPDDFIACILAKFEAAHLGFMAAINLQNIDLPAGTVVSQATVDDGSLHGSPIMIYADGKPNPGGWHGTPPNFNPLHPAVQGYVESQIDDLLARHGGSPAFKGIVLHLTKHTIPWFGSIEAGYNDYAIAAFEKDTGIHVPVDRSAPLRGKLYADWLLANAHEPWVQWRCRKMADWYRSLAARLAAKRPDLRLSLFSYNPTLTDHAGDPRYAQPDFARLITRESGIDAGLLAGIPNLILSQTLYPADYRWSSGEQWLEKARPAARDDHRRPGVYDLIGGAAEPWINMHDRYFEDPVGGSAPLTAEWLKEVPWRVSTLNPGGDEVLEHYVLPLRFQDVLGFTKGGFLIGTCGAEERLAAFARAYRALPASRFADLPGPAGAVRARSLARPDGTWFYVVNTDPAPAAVRIVFARAPGTVTDLGAGKQLEGVGTRLQVELQPYQLRSFRVAAGIIATVME